MEQVVYIDVLFIINLLINSLLLYATSWIIKYRLSIGRLLLASVISALYAAVMFFPKISFLYTVAGRLIFTAALLFFTFRTFGIWRFVKTCAVFLLVSFAFGGATFAVFLFTDYAGKLGAVVSNGTLYFDLNAGVLFLSAGLAYAILFLFRRVFARNFTRDKLILPVIITVDEKQYEVRGLIDTGCEMEDGLTGTPVMITEGTIFGEADLSHHLFVLPYTTVDGGRHDLYALKPDRVEVRDRRFWVGRTPLVGISGHKLSDDGLYQAVLNPEILVDKIELVGGKEDGGAAEQTQNTTTKDCVSDTKV